MSAHSYWPIGPYFSPLILHAAVNSSDVQSLLPAAAHAFWESSRDIRLAGTEPPCEMALPSRTVASNRSMQKSPSATYTVPLGHCLCPEVKLRPVDLLQLSAMQEIARKW